MSGVKLLRSLGVLMKRECNTGNIMGLKSIYSMCVCVSVYNTVHTVYCVYNLL